MLLFPFFGPFITDPTLSTIVNILWLIGFLLQSIGLYYTAKRQGDPTPGFAVVPFLNVLLLGRIADDINNRIAKRTHKRILIPVMAVTMTASGVAAFIYNFFVLIGTIDPLSSSAEELARSTILFYLFAAIAVAAGILFYLLVLKALMVIFKDCFPNAYVKLMMLCIFVPVAEGACLIVVSHRMGWPPSQTREEF